MRAIQYQEGPQHKGLSSVYCELVMPELTAAPVLPGWCSIRFTTWPQASCRPARHWKSCSCGVPPEAGRQAVGMEFAAVMDRLIDACHDHPLGHDSDASMG